MAAFTYAYSNSRNLLVTLLASALTAIILQRFGPALILIIFLLPWFITLFYYYPVMLIALWHVLSIVTVLFPDLFFPMGPILFLPLDPAFFFSLIYIAIIIMIRPASLTKTLRENQYLIIFITIVVAYAVIYMPLYGKSAIGEARKSYFFFFFPILSSFIVKDLRDLRRLILLFFLVGLSFLIVALSRFMMGFPLRSLSSAAMNLVLLFQVFSILIFWLNQRVIINRFTDASVLTLSLAILILRPHRSVIIASAFGLLLICLMFRNRFLFLLKLIILLVAFFIIVVIAMLNIPTFEKASMIPLKGILDPRSDGTASWRMQGWQQQLSKLSPQELLFGKGFGSYFMWYNKKYREKVRVDPHNGYVQIILKLGLLGLIMYGLLVFTFFRKVIPVWKKLPQGPMKAFVEISILNVGVAHAYMMGYGFADGFSGIMLLFYAMGMGAVRLCQDYGRSVGQLEPKNTLHFYKVTDLCSFQRPGRRSNSSIA
jgi:O-Antigen ligase